MIEKELLAHTTTKLTQFNSCSKYTMFLDLIFAINKLAIKKNILRFKSLSYSIVINNINFKTVNESSETFYDWFKSNKAGYYWFFKKNVYKIIIKPLFKIKAKK